jgi:hypothetical protein
MNKRYSPGVATIGRISATGFVVCLLISITGHANLVQSPTSGGPPAGIAFVQNTAGANCIGASTCVATLTGTTVHNFFAVGVYITLGSPGVTVSSITADNGTSCSLATGTQNTSSSGGFFTTQIGYCQNNSASGTINVTAHLTGTTSGGGGSIFTIGVGEFSGVSLSGADIGAGSTGIATVDPVTASVTTTQTNQLVFSLATRDGTFGFSSIGGNQIEFPSSSNIFTYQITDSIGTVTHSFSTGDTSHKIMSVAAFSHP